MAPKIEQFLRTFTYAQLQDISVWTSGIRLTRGRKATYDPSMIEEIAAEILI